jgi:hypothetical protein
MIFRELPPAWRLPLLLMAMASLLTGVLGGLARLAVDVPVFAQVRAGGHGALMITAFFGTVISLERAVALHRFWPYLGPFFAGSGGIILLTQGPWWLPPLFFCLAGSILLAASLQVWRQLPVLFTFTLLFGVAAWLAGNIAWLGGMEIGTAALFWMSFLVLTIAGERLELTRFLPPQPLGQKIFIALLALIAAALALLPFAVETGSQILAGAFLVLAGWLLRYDIARRTVWQTGLTRFVAVCLLSGYAWLAIGGALGLLGAFMPGHAWRDAALHAVFIGFVFSMVIGHAPIIFPAVMRVRIPYHPFFYLPLLALHASLLLRVAGNLGESWALRQTGAVLNAVSLALFVLTILLSVARGAASRKPAA